MDLEMTLDNMGWTGPRYDDYTSVAYWYQTLPSTPKFTFEPSADLWHVGYGYQFWISPYPGSYRADGAFGQITTILPEKGLVVSIQCPERGNFDQVKRALHEHFLMEL